MATKTAKRKPATKSWWCFEEISQNVHRIQIQFERSQQYHESLWISDLHWDNPKCDRAALKRTLDEALEKQAPIFIIGDLFCAMQGAFDKRKNKNDIRPEHQQGDYLDALVKTGVEWFTPYAKNIALVTEGNHESKIYSIHETNLLDRLAYGLRERGGITRYGGYQGWVQHNFKYVGHQAAMQNFFYHHGFGGGGPVTKGAIDFNRLSEQVIADVYVSGHVHRRNTNDQALMMLTIKGNQVIIERDYVRLSTYKQEGDQPYGWAVERGMGPRPIGGQWCRMTLQKLDTGAVVRRQFIKTV